MTPDVVLFDLDGTISDSARSILGALQSAFAEHGLPALDPAVERTILGPPFYETLPPLIGEIPLGLVIDSYRQRYAAEGGMLDTDLFPGVGELIVAVAATGTRLALATSKPEIYAGQILAHLGVASHFEVIGGDALDGSRSTKALVIADVLDRLGRPDPSTVLMIGDREHDVLGARANHIDAVGVTWGYAPPGELESVAPMAIVDTAAEAASLLEIELAA